MLRKTQGIVLRAVKYGDTSLIVTIFTEQVGVQAYIVQGVRSSSARNKAAYFQPGMILDLVVYAQPNRSMQHVREFQARRIYKTLSEDVVKNTIALFAVEVLLRILPDSAPMPDLYNESASFLCFLDDTPVSSCANAPLCFLSLCSGLLGYGPAGNFSDQTPYLDISAGGFSAHPPSSPPFTSSQDAHALGQIISAGGIKESSGVLMTSDMRLRLTDWYIAFMQRHSEHMGNIRSLPVLRAILR